MKVKKSGIQQEKRNTKDSSNKTIIALSCIVGVLLIVLTYFIIYGNGDNVFEKFSKFEKKDYRDTVLKLDTIGYYSEESKYFQLVISGVGCGLKIDKNDYQEISNKWRELEVHAKRQYIPKLNFWNLYDIIVYDTENEKEFRLALESEEQEDYETDFSYLSIKNFRIHDSEIVNLISDMLITNNIQTKCLDEIFNIRQLFSFEYFDLNSDGIPEFFVYGNTQCNQGARRCMGWIMQKTHSFYKCIYDFSSYPGEIGPINSKHNGYFDIKEVGTVSAGTIEVTFWYKFEKGKYVKYNQSEKKIIF